MRRVTHQAIVSADHVTVDKEGEFAADAIRLSGGDGVHIVFDESGPATFQGLLDILRRSDPFCWYGPVLGGSYAIAIMSLPRSIKIGATRPIPIMSARRNWEGLEAKSTPNSVPNRGGGQRRSSTNHRGR